MIYKRCGRCGGRVPSGTTCSCSKKNMREYAKATGVKKEYHTQRWKNLRQYVMIKYNNLDIYMLYKYGRVISADTVHHIELSQDRPDLFYSDQNLIPLSRPSHAEIHERYRKEGKATVQTELRGFLMRYQTAGDRKKFWLDVSRPHMPHSFHKILKTKKKLANERREARGQDREYR